MSFRVACGLGTLLFLSSFLAPAQDTRGKVQGLVSDPSNAVVAGATVTLRNENTGVQAQKVTDEYGKYLFDYVLPGDYTVSVELSGFTCHMPAVKLDENLRFANHWIGVFGKGQTLLQVR